MKNAGINPALLGGGVGPASAGSIASASSKAGGTSTASVNALPFSNSLSSAFSAAAQSVIANNSSELANQTKLEIEKMRLLRSQMYSNAKESISKLNSNGYSTSGWEQL